MSRYPKTTMETALRACALADLGVPRKEIAFRLGVSRSRVDAWIGPQRKNGRGAAPHRDQIVALYTAGKTVRAIAEAIGVPQNTVAGFVYSARQNGEAWAEPRRTVTRPRLIRAAGMRP